MLKLVNKIDAEICIVGLGPAGIGSALKFSEYDIASSVLCIDAGKNISDRSCSVLHNGLCDKDNPCQVISGFGGCSLLGGGKVSNYPAGSGLEKILGSEYLIQKKYVEALNLLNKYLILHKEEIEETLMKKEKDMYEKKGFEYKFYDVYLFSKNDIKKCYEKIHHHLEKSGMKIMMETELCEIKYDSKYYELNIRKENKLNKIYAKKLLLAMGRLGKNFLKKLNNDLNLWGEVNKLDVGVRLEFPYNIMPNLTKYHKDLKLLFKNARTFCVCENGSVAPYHLNDMYVVDGHLDIKHLTDFTNLSILVRYEPNLINEHNYEDIKRRMKILSNGKPITQNLINFLKNNYSDAIKTYKDADFFWVKGDINKCFPREILKDIKRAVDFFASNLIEKSNWNNVALFAPEIEYGGLCFPVKSDFSIIPGLYLIGDCVGKFRGNLQAFCSGIICAEKMLGDIYGAGE